MRVRQISITKSLIEGLEHMTPEELIVYIARVSNPSNQENLKTTNKLLRWTIGNKHWSPFDMANFCVEVITSKAIGIQILRHWSIKPQEFSQRYAEVTDIEPIELRKNGSTNRQSSTVVFDPELTEYIKGNKASTIVKSFIELSKTIYNSLLRADVAKECARMVLPMATSTTMYLNGSIRSWIHYLQQRLDPHAQVEHQLVAQEIEKLFKSHFPEIWQAVQDLKRSEDPEFIIINFHEWCNENEWFNHSSEIKGMWWNLDELKKEISFTELYSMYKNDKQWHAKQ